MRKLARRLVSAPAGAVLRYSREMRRALIALALASGGCLDGAGGGGVSGPYTELVLNELILPTTTAQAEMLSFNLDGTGAAADNALGTVISLIGGVGLDLQAGVDGPIANGDVVILHAIQAESLESGPASWQVYLGDASATPPAFDGSDTFTRSATGINNALLGGTITRGRFAGGPATVRLILKFGTDVDFLIVDLIGAQIQADVSAAGATNAVIGGAITAFDVEMKVVPAIAQVMTGIMLEGCTCTGSGPPACTADTAGDSLDSMFNSTHDCEITGPELAANPLVENGLAADVDMFNGTKFEPGVDGEPDSLSMGVGFTAVPALFDRPNE